MWVAAAIDKDGHLLECPGHAQRTGIAIRAERKPRAAPLPVREQEGDIVTGTHGARRAMAGEIEVEPASATERVRGLQDQKQLLVNVILRRRGRTAVRQDQLYVPPGQPSALF